MVWVCCVPNCKNTKRLENIVFRSLPDPVIDAALFNLWLRRIHLKMPDNVEPSIWRKKYRICDVHFSQYCRLPGTSRLKKNCAPSLFLPDFLEDNEENSFFVENYVDKHIISTSGIKVISDVLIQSPNKLQQVRDLGHSTEVNKENSFHTDSASLEAIPSTSIESPDRSPQVRELRRDNSTINLLKSVNVKTPHQLTPKAKKMYRKVLQLKSVRRKLLSKENSHKEQLKMAFELSKGEFLSNISPLVRRFILMQSTQSKKHPRGRRFSQQEKIMALSIYKQGAGGYKILKAMGFALPSKQTLVKMMKSIRFRAGINLHIFESLKNSTRQMEPKDRFCNLIFDEMALQPSLFYDESLDEVIGLEDYGAEKIMKFADHAQVFMLRGIRKKWKQPIVYGFSEHSMHKSILQNLLKEIIKKCQEIGLTVVATVCDQGNSNVAAINNLITETVEKYQHKGEELQLVGFEVDGKLIVPIFDPPQKE